MKNTTIGNQQERLIAAKSWLAGMIDADGCITFAVSYQKYRNKQGNQTNKLLDPLVDIATSCTGTKDVLVKTIKFIGAACYVTGRYKKNPCYTIRVSGLRRVNNFLPLVIPYMVTKKEEAEKLLQFCQSRLAKQIKFKSSPYTSEELELFSSIKKIKVIRILRDYMPDILWLQDKDIVRSHDESVS